MTLHLLPNMSLSVNRPSWQFTDKLDSNLWSVDGDTDGRDSLPSTDHKLNWWSVDGDTDGRDSLLTHSIQHYGR